MHGVSRGVGNGNLFFTSHVDENSVSTSSIEEQSKSNPQAHFKYNNLNKLAEQEEIVRLDQEDAFFVITTHPAEQKAKTGNGHNFEWKLHISVNPDQLSEAFDLAAPIISKYCFLFKVTNQGKVESERFKQGTQITIPLEGQEGPVISPEDTEKMMWEIHQVFSENNIGKGKKPDSDAETISPYFSMRNDKIIFTLHKHKVSYIPAFCIGKNFNPANNPNPFSHLLSSEVKPFDAFEHFQSFEADLAGSNVSREYMYYQTLQACVREYTIFDEMDEKSQQEFILQFALNNGENSDAEIVQLLKHNYKNNPAMLLMVKQSFSLMLAFEADGGLSQSIFNSYVVSAQFSTQNPLDPSFKKLMHKLETHSAQTIKEYRLVRNETVPTLLHLLQLSSQEIIKDSSKEELITYIQKGNFYDAEAALEKLEWNYGKEEYKKLLHENESIPAVQIALAKIYKSEDSETSDKYLLNVLQSDTAKYLDLWRSDPKKCIGILMKHHNLEQLQAMSQSGNPIAMLTLVCIYIRDLFPGDLPGIEKFANAPKDFVEAKKYIAILRLNPLHAEVVAAFDSLLK